MTIKIGKAGGQNVFISGSVSSAAKWQLFGDTNFVPSGNRSLTLSGVIEDGSGTNKVTYGRVANTLGVTLSGAAANTYVGGTLVNIFSNTSNVNANKAGASGTGLLTVNVGLVKLGANQSINGLAGLAGSSVTGNNTNVANQRELGINSANNASYAGALGNIGTGENNLRLVKNGIGIQTLSGTSTYTGTTSASGGTLIAASTSALGTSAAGTTIASGATLDVQANIGIEAISVEGAGVGSNGALVTGTGSGTVGGGVTLTNDAKVGGAGSLTIAGAIGGAFKVTKVGAGTTTLSGAQNYTTLATNEGVTNVSGAFTGGTATVNANATTNFTVSQTLAALNIGTVPLAGLGAAPAFTGGGSAVVPEPGSMGLLLTGALGLLARRRRARTMR